MADGIFEADELAADAQGAETELAATDESQQSEGPARDEHGKFAAKPEATAQGEAEGAQGEAEPARKGDGTVPQGALHAEREKRKGVEAELTKARETLAAIQQMREQIANRKPEPLPEADDPAAIEHLRQRIAQQDQTINRFGQQMDSQAIEQRETRELGAVMQASENDYRAVQPDYDNAIQHVIQARANELSLYGLNPADIQQTIAEEAMDIVRSAVQQGRNPAELGYQIALSRGYRPAAGEAGQEGQQQQQGGAQATLAALATARAGSKSLGQAGGGGTAKTLNAEAIAAMDPDEFDALYSTPAGQAMIDAL